jgi:hypothetical protein
VRAAPAPKRFRRRNRAPELRETAAFRAAAPFLVLPPNAETARHLVRRAAPGKVGRGEENFVTGTGATGRNLPGRPDLARKLARRHSYGSPGSPTATLVNNKWCRSSNGKSLPNWSASRDCDGPRWRTPPAGGWWAACSPISRSVCPLSWQTSCGPAVTSVAARRCRSASTSPRIACWRGFAGRGHKRPSSTIPGPHWAWSSRRVSRAISGSPHPARPAPRYRCVSRARRCQRPRLFLTGAFPPLSANRPRERPTHGRRQLRRPGRDPQETRDHTAWGARDPRALAR